MAPTIGFLIVARIFQAIGGCVSIVIARAIIRDTTDGAGSTKAMAYLGMALGVTPAVAPLIGGQLEVFFGWQASFLATAIFGAGVTVASFFKLEETLLPADRRTTRVGALAATYARLMRMPVFVGYALNLGFTGAAFQAFIAGTPVAFIVIMGVSPQTLGYYIVSVALAYTVGNYASSQLSFRVPRNTMNLDRLFANDRRHRDGGPPGAERPCHADNSDYSVDCLQHRLRLHRAQRVWPAGWSRSNQPTPVPRQL